MKKIIFAAVMLSVMGCAKHQTQMLTGSICVRPFDIQTYDTNDPVQITPAVVEQTGKRLQLKISDQLRKDSELTVIEDCSASDYILSGKFYKYNLRIRQQVSWAGMEAHRFYDVGVEATLQRRNGKVMSSFTDDDASRNFEDILPSLSERLVDKVKEESL